MTGLNCGNWSALEWTDPFGLMGHEAECGYPAIAEGAIGDALCPYFSSATPSGSGNYPWPNNRTWRKKGAIQARCVLTDNGNGTWTPGWVKTTTDAQGYCVYPFVNITDTSRTDYFLYRGDARLWILAMYEAILSRDYWRQTQTQTDVTNALATLTTGGMSRIQFMRNMFTSPEFQAVFGSDCTTLIYVLHQAILARQPDFSHPSVSGPSGWISICNSNSVGTVFDMFINEGGPEMQNWRNANAAFSWGTP